MRLASMHIATKHSIIEFTVVAYVLLDGEMVERHPYPCWSNEIERQSTNIDFSAHTLDSAGDQKKTQ